ncbi:MAG TPA: ABC transporter permease subunit, partial [Bdellovibrio sp.]|nr:ABC transporter permease subunit [Bdellovibrio sp.]
MSPRNVLRLSLVLFLLFPFLFLLTQFRLQGFSEWSELRWAFKNSFLQAFFSALMSLFFGVWAALGLLSFSQNSRRRYWRMILEVLCLLPNFLPPIFILLATLNVVDPFPMGVTGIVLIHTLMNFGLVAVLLSGIIENKIGGVIELAYVEGASRFQFLTRGFFPMIKKDLWLLGLFVFVICFGSFSVPLIVGGGKGTTIEVLIYEKIRLSNDWGGAVVLAILQSVFIFSLSLIASRGRGMHRSRLANLSLIRVPTGIIVIVLISLLYLLGYMQGLVAGFGMISTFYELQSALFWNFLGSLLIGIGVGILCYITLMVIAYCWPKLWFE